jgi:uncharacterized protein YoxC
MITSTWHILALVLSVGSVFLIIYLVKLLIQLRETLRTVEDTLTRLQNEVSPVINNVEGITGNVENMTGRADNIFATVQDKTVSTMSVLDSVKDGLEVLKHSLFLFLNHLSKHSNALGLGIKAGLSNLRKKESLEAPVVNKPVELLTQPTMQIVDHLEHIETKSK